MISFSSRISVTLLLMAEVARDFALTSAKPFKTGLTRISSNIKKSGHYEDKYDRKFRETSFSFVSLYGH